MLPRKYGTKRNVFEYKQRGKCYNNFSHHCGHSLEVEILLHNVMKSDVTERL